MKRYSLILGVIVALIALPAAATEVQEVVSPGGIKAWLVEEHALPLVAVKIAFTGSGYAYDPAGHEGRTGMTAALLMEGAGDMPSREFNEALENEAIQLDFSTDEDLFRASMETLSEHKVNAFRYLGLALAHPRFDDSAIERVKSQTLSLLTQQEQEPGYILHRNWQKLAFADHPYGQPVLGTKDSVGKLDKSDVSAFARRYLTRENMLIGVVGDITPAELGKLLDANLGDLPTHYDPDATVKEVTLPLQAQQVVIQHDIPQSMVIFGTAGIKRNDPDYYAAYVMNQVLGGGGSLTAKLGVEIREKRGLAYAVYSQLDPMMHSASWRGGFATRNDQVGTALDVLRSTLKDFSANGPTDQELTDAKQYLIGSFVLGLDSNADIASYLISMQLFHLGRDYLDKRNQIIESVQKDQVKAMAARLTDPNKLLVVVVGKPQLAVKP